ncbi:MAG: 3-dehydroquinate dehydratase [Lachnospiraceae bacterium]|nr:3-dehydroquinate dehydratase [Lachnospiraceae bacterium]
MKILVINGPNLNFLGIREVDVYGREDYDFLRQKILKKAAQENIIIEIFQSNYEGAIIDKIQESYSDQTDGIVINPGAYAYYSYAIHDALISIPTPKVEVHIADITHRQEEWRRHSITAAACNKFIKGRGLEGYCDAIDYLIEDYKNKQNK